MQHGHPRLTRRGKLGSKSVVRHAVVGNVQEMWYGLFGVSSGLVLHVAGPEYYGKNPNNTFVRELSNVHGYEHE